MPDRIMAAAAAVCAAALAVTVVVLGVTHPPTPAPITTDRLGPDSGELVSDYLARAAASVDPAAADVRWGLVGFDTEVTATRARELVGAAAEISQVWFRVPLDRVQTPLVPVGVSGAESIDRAPGYAAARLQVAAASAQEQAPAADRQSRVAAVSAARLVEDCACVVAVTVRAPQRDLAALAAVEGVRVVEALPGAAVFGRFAVSPLLPEQTVAVLPGADDGEVPDR